MHHKTCMSIILVLVLSGATANLLFIQQGDRIIQQREAQHQLTIAELEQDIQQIIADKKAKAAAAALTAEAVITPGAQHSEQTLSSTSCNSSEKHMDAHSIDVVVNKKHCIQPLTFTPDNLITVYGATLTAEAADHFKRLYEASAAAGYPIQATSSFRSYNDQVSTYNYWVSVSGKAGAETYSARPGYSEHQTGLAVDIASSNGCSLDCFGSTAAYQWIQQHAADFGFIQRYYAGQEAITGYKAEEWHYRYVGIATAVDMKSKGVMTLEAYWNLPGGGY